VNRDLRQDSIVLTLPILTDRLELTPLTQVDRDAFVAYRRLPEVARWQSWTPDYTDADADDLIASQPSSIESESGRWLQVAVRRDGALVGDVAVHALAQQPDTYELGVTIAPASQGLGYATEALGALIAGLFGAQGAHRVFAVTDARNEPVARLFQRLGFRHEGRNVDADWFKGEWTSIDTWAALRT
jgi:RimJ/RimL family protein N-acetyltransferase